MRLPLLHVAEGLADARQIERHQLDAEPAAVHVGRRTLLLGAALRVVDEHRLHRLAALDDLVQERDAFDPAGDEENRCRIHRRRIRMR